MASGAYRSRDDLLRSALRTLEQGTRSPREATEGDPGRTASGASPARGREPGAASGEGHGASAPIEGELAALLEGVGDTFYALDREWRYTFVNRAAEAYYGRGRETLLGQVIWELFPWTEGTELRARFEHAMASGEPVAFESSSVVVPGRSLELRLFPFNGGLGVSFRDWTERGRAEEALRESEGRLRLAIEAGRLAIWELDVVSGVLKPSPDLNAILGYPRDAILDLDEVRGRYGPGDRERLNQAGQEALARGERHFQSEYRFLRPDGVWRWYLLRAEVLFGATGAPERVVGVVLDITDRKQAEEALRESETRLGIATAAANLGIWDWDVTTKHMVYSDRARSIYGFPQVGEITYDRVRDATHPEDLPRISSLARRALDPKERGKTPYEYRIRRPDGEERWVLAHGETLFGEVEGAEAAVRFVGTVQDITDQKRAEAALRESEARLSALTDNLPFGMVYQVLVSPDGSERRFTYVSKNCERVNGITAEAALENAALLYGSVAEEHLAEILAQEREAIARMEPFDVEVPMRHARTGEMRWYRIMSAPRRLPDGSTVWDGLQVDITEQREAARRTEERLRTVLSEMPVGVMLARIPGGEVIFRNAKAVEITGDRLTVPSIEDYGHFGAVHPDGTPYRSEEYPIARTVLTGEDIDREPVIYRRADETIHLEVSSAPVRWSPDEGFAVCAFYDVTERMRAEEHQRLLINELNHRVKNTLATVQSIASQTLRPVESSDGGGLVFQARSAFEARLFALARAHDVLTRENWDSASLHDIAAEAVAPHHDGPEGLTPFTIEGPALRVTPQMALSLSMALHELATNAVKYGALSQSGGSVRIAWSTPQTPDGRRLKLLWTERGGPPVLPPTRKGFGTRLIERGLARELGGAVQIVYDAPGLRCAVDVPLEG